MALNVAKALRICLIEAISSSTEEQISFINSNDVAFVNFCNRACIAMHALLQQQGLSHLVTDAIMDPEKNLHLYRTFLGNAPKMLEDLRGLAPSFVSNEKLALWNPKWREEVARSKRTKDLFGASSLPKRLKTTIGASASPGYTRQQDDPSGARTMWRKLRNHQCAPTIGIPFDAIKPGRDIGEGSFGQCVEATIDNISYFPSDLKFCAKMYKGSNNAKLQQFQVERGMQKVNASIVRCIAFTLEPPWVTVFPLFNGGTLNDVMMWGPFKECRYRRTIERLRKPSVGFSPNPDKVPNAEEKARIVGIINNMPNIIHALVDGMKAVHSAGIIHSNLHAKNMVLDFTKENIPRVGIIDWGLILISGMTRSAINCGGPNDSMHLIDERRWKGDLERRRRPWIAPEIYDPLCQSAYSKESDVYAIGWLIMCLVEFWRLGQNLWLCRKPRDAPDEVIMHLIELKASDRMLVDDRAIRISFANLDDFLRVECGIDPAKAQSPLVELGPILAHPF